MTPKPSSGYFPALDGFRFFCCSAVVAAHSLVNTPLVAFGYNLGRLGVDAFFTLSGFLITKLLLEEAGEAGKINLRAFYIRRSIRIWPVYYIALLGFALPSIWGGRLNSTFGYQLQPGFLSETLPLYAVFLANATSAPLPTPLQVLWSISVEEQFYLFFPSLLLLNQRLTGRWYLAKNILVLLLFTFAVRAAMAFPRPLPHDLHQTWLVIDFLLLGSLGAHLLHDRPELIRRLVKMTERWIFVLIGLSGAMLLLLFNFASDAWLFLLFNPIVGFIFTSFILYLAVSNVGSGVTRLLSLPAITNLGRVTYAAYVFHMYPLAAAWAFTTKLGFENTIGAGILRFTFSMPLVFGIALLSKRFVENPAASLRSRLLSRYSTGIESVPAK